MKLLLAIAATLPMVVSANAAVPNGFSFTGNWPLSVSRSPNPGSNRFHCLTLTDNGSVGFPHSGPAVLDARESFSLSGQFQIIGSTFIVSFDIPGGATGQNGGEVFAAPTRNGQIGQGAFNEIFGGSLIDSGEVVFGNKGGC